MDAQNPSGTFWAFLFFILIRRKSGSKKGFVLPPGHHYDLKPLYPRFGSSTPGSTHKTITMVWFVYTMGILRISKPKIKKIVLPNLFCTIVTKFSRED